MQSGIQIILLSQKSYHILKDAQRFKYILKLFNA